MEDGRDITTNPTDIKRKMKEIMNFMPKNSRL